MVVIVIVNHEGEGGRPGVPGSHQAVSAKVLLPVELRHETLHQRSVQLPHLLAGNPGRVPGHIRGEPGVVAVVLVHLEAADALVDGVVPEAAAHNLPDLRKGIVRQQAVPLRMRAGVRPDLPGDVASGRHDQIHPEVDLDALVRQSSDKAVRIGEASRIPLV